MSNSEQYNNIKDNYNNINLLLDSIYNTISKKDFDFFYKKIQLDNMNQPLTYNNIETNLLGHFLNHLSQNSLSQFDSDQMKISMIKGQSINAHFNIINKLIKDGSNIFTTIPKQQQDVSLPAIYFNITNESNVKRPLKSNEYIYNIEKSLFEDQQFQDIDNLLTFQQLNQDFNYLLSENSDHKKNAFNIQQIFDFYYQYSVIRIDDLLNLTTTKICNFLNDNQKNEDVCEFINKFFLNQFSNTYYITELLQSNNDKNKINLIEKLSQALAHQDFVVPDGNHTIMQLTDSIDFNKPDYA